MFFMLASCQNNRIQEKPQKETPKALEEKSYYDVVSGRGGENILEGLYSELVTKDVALKKLEEKLEDLNSSEGDSSASFKRFDSKTLAYFSSAERHVAEIGDSLLRDKMKLLVAGNLTKYKSQIARHDELLKAIEARRMRIADLYIVLKIVKTLPLMEKYQKDNLPETDPLEGFIKQQDRTISMVDSLVK